MVYSSRLEVHQFYMKQKNNSVTNEMKKKTNENISSSPLLLQASTINTLEKATNSFA